MLALAFAWWFLLLIPAFLVASAAGRRLDRTPTVGNWVNEELGLGDWPPMPRKLGDEPATGSQLIALCQLAHAHGDVISYRNLPRGTVEAAIRESRGYDLYRIDQAGHTQRHRHVEVRLPAMWALKKALADDARWSTIKTDEEPSE
jgi:hypothetical protein